MYCDDVLCPICDHPSQHKIYTMDNLFTVEEYIDCEPCNYHYSFTYGYYHEIIGGEDFYWSYDQPKDEMVEIRKKKADMIRNFREKLKSNTKGAQ